jgi:hypothetical protein
MGWRPSSLVRSRATPVQAGTPPARRARSCVRAHHQLPWRACSWWWLCSCVLHAHDNNPRNHTQRSWRVTRPASLALTKTLCYTQAHRTTFNWGGFASLAAAQAPNVRRRDTPTHANPTPTPTLAYEYTAALPTHPPHTHTRPAAAGVREGPWWWQHTDAPRTHTKQTSAGSSAPTRRAAPCAAWGPPRPKLASKPPLPLPLLLLPSRRALPLLPQSK